MRGRVGDATGLRLLATNGHQFDFEILEPAAGKNISEIPVLLRLQGKIIDFIDILKSIEKADKTLSVKSLEINRAAGQDLRYFLTVTAFRVER